MCQVECGFLVPRPLLGQLPLFVSVLLFWAEMVLIVFCLHVIMSTQAWTPARPGASAVPAVPRAVGVGCSAGRISGSSISGRFPIAMLTGRTSVSARGFVSWAASRRRTGRCSGSRADVVSGGGGARRAAGV